MCVKEKCGTCKRKLKANLQYELLSKADLSWVPNPAGIEFTVKVENCRKRATDECLCLFMQFIKKKCPFCGGYDMDTEIPIYDNAKTRLCQEQRKSLGTE